MTERDFLAWRSLTTDQLLESAWILAKQVEDRQSALCLEELIARLRRYSGTPGLVGELAAADPVAVPRASPLWV